MSNEEHNNEQSTSKQPADLRHAILEKSLSDKKKKSPLSAWDRLRENVSEFHSSDNSGVFVASPTSSNNSSPSSSRSSTPKPYQQSAIPPPKNKSLNPFMRSSTFDNYMHGNNSSSDSRPNITLANTTLVAAQAAGMTNFTRNFRPARHHNGVIYATSTAVQQDIYRLERDLDKILIQLHARSQHASFAESASTLVSTTVTDGSQTSTPATFGKKSVFQRQSVADMFSGSSTPHSDTMSPIKEPFRQEVTRLSFVMTSILDSIKKHKSATRLPLTGEILAVLAAPFDRIPLIGTFFFFFMQTFDDGI